MNPRITRFAFLAALALVAGAPRSVAAARPLNVVFILVDDLGWMDIGANNPDGFYDTPHIDRLAASGVNFTSGYAANPVCSPTRYSLLTGRYPSRADVTNWFSGRRSSRFRGAAFNDAMPLGELTLAEALGAQGYATLFAGKWHLGDDPTHWPEHQGFDVNIGGWSRGSPMGGYFAPFENPRLDPAPDGAHLPEVLTTRALDALASVRDQPFLLYLSYYSVHTPLQGRPDLVAKYEARRDALPDAPDFGPEEQCWLDAGERRVRIRQSHPVYAAMVEALDDQVGRVLDALDAWGLAESTAVFFTGDNGGLSTSEGSPTSNLPLRGGKGWVYEGGIREPFLVRWPGVTAPGSRCDVPVITTDVYPTILDMAGLPPRPEQHLDGVSLAPLLRGGDTLDRPRLFWHYPHYGNQGGFPGGAVREGPWKLVERYEDGRVHLYHLGDDIGERTDLSARHPDRVAGLRAHLHTWYRDVDAKFLRPLDQPDAPQPWTP